MKDEGFGPPDGEGGIGPGPWGPLGALVKRTKWVLMEQRVHVHSCPTTRPVLQELLAGQGETQTWVGTGTAGRKNERMTDVSGQDLGALWGDGAKVVDSQAEETTNQEAGLCRDVEREKS